MHDAAFALPPLFRTSARKIVRGGVLSLRACHQPGARDAVCSWYCCSGKAVYIYIFVGLPLLSLRHPHNLKPLRACFNPLRRARERAERNEAARGHSFCSHVQKRVLGPCRILGLASRIRTSDLHSLHMPRHQHAAVRKLLSTSILGGVHLLYRSNDVAICSRSAIPKSKRGYCCYRKTLVLPLPKMVYVLFSSCFTESNRFPKPKSTSIPVANNVPFVSFQCSPSRTAVPFWGQTTQKISSSVPP